MLYAVERVKTGVNRIPAMMMQSIRISKMK
jgi:hypothetical protein